MGVLDNRRGWDDELVVVVGILRRFGGIDGGDGTEGLWGASTGAWRRELGARGDAEAPLIVMRGKILGR